MEKKKINKDMLVNKAYKQPFFLKNWQPKRIFWEKNPPNLSSFKELVFTLLNLNNRS